MPPWVRAALIALYLWAAPGLVPNPAAAPPGPEPAVLKASARWSVDEARPGEQVVLAVILDITEGFHINADAGQLAAHPTFRPYPTQVQVLEQSPPAVAGAPRYPPAHVIEVAFAPQPLAVFDGRVAVTLPVDVPADMTAGVLMLRLALRYQGCDATSCWMPATITLTPRLPIAVAPDR